MAHKTANRVAFITGASSGIGFASAQILLENGFTVYATARRTELMEPLKQKGAKILHCDVTSDEDVQKAVDTIVANEGRIDILFANAGYCLLGPVELVSNDEVTRQFDVNVVGCGRPIAAVIPHMRKAGSGRILITSSGAGHVSMPNMAWYAATKHAQQGLAHGLRMELAEFGIQVVLIEPGGIDTNIYKPSLATLDVAERHPNAGAYRQQTTIFRKKWSSMVNDGSPVDTIARVVLQASTAARPRRQYRPNGDARLGAFLKRWGGYAALDRIVPGMTIR